MRLEEGQDISADETLFGMPSAHRTHRLKFENPGLEELLSAAE
jgi:hypothetical protein